ncbi:acyl-CoA N-acyltransferase [Coniophora puteana RWD-64-598 SS2]|uniref:Acyl-CoA N-acyltransferase n=1 Tax=Coniophora puteana (strain RWD-64-598) TaxID=741705 RepID=A0A5M3MRK5_CONPW|nr:acyl-CoA N-acyltransferase [Coniophora puteana RWD-64-598 SS2]EIW81384.1 acyl-CoA N-acyltransferase [Coniophora puteana RWD-64-598 SS2]
MTFTTQRLALRARTDDDLDDLLALWNNTQVQPMLHSHPFAPMGPKARKDIGEWLDGCVFGSIVTLCATDSESVSSATAPATANTITNANATSEETQKPKDKGGAFMGFLALSIQEPKNRDASVHIALLPQYWGGGYAKEALTFLVDHAFRWLGVHRVSLVVYGSNVRAIGLYERLGFVVEGRKREALWMDNKWEDSVSMGVLRREWAAKYWEDQS